MIAAPRRPHLSFGTFEVDLDSLEIRKAGLRIKLQGQPFRVLVMLLSRPGEVITRDELQQEIWGRNTTVDFERGIASAINKIREALGDSADNPRFIETLAKRGYRFVAPVSVEALPAATVSFPEPPPVLPAMPAPEDPAWKKAPEAEAPLLPSPVPPMFVASLTAPALPAPTEALLPAAVLPPAASAAEVPARSAFRSMVVWGLALAVVLLMAVASWITYLASRPSVTLRPPRLEQLTQSSMIYSGPPNPENLLTLVSDGPRIYTSVLANGRTQISAIDLAGTQVQAVSSPEELGSVSIADISPDGSRLIVRSWLSRDSEQPLWILPTAGSSASRVGEVLAHDATWMPKGNSILFASGKELGLAQLDTGAVTPYATVPGRAFWPRWSPDGATLRFTLLDPASHMTSLWQLDAATRRMHQVQLPELAGMSVCCGSWTFDGKSYVFQASDAQGSNLWAMGTGAHPELMELTNGPLAFMSPLPSRGDRTIYFLGLDEPANLQIFDAKLRRFTPAPSFLSHARRVTYSRDSRWVAWTDASGRLWRAHSADGSGRLRLSEEDLEIFLMHWSPDDQQLVLMARKPGEAWQIYTVSAAGGVAHRLLHDTRNLADPDWSPDGQQIVFGREADLMGKESGPYNIQILDVATHQVHSVPGSERLFSPRWSPDGRWILALSEDQSRLLLYDVQRNTWKTMFRGGAADPVWDGDSRSIVFHAFSQPDSAILRLSLEGSLQHIADLSSLDLPSVPNYFFSGITPSGAPLIEPRVGIGNLYSLQVPPTR